MPENAPATRAADMPGPSAPLELVPRANLFDRIRKLQDDIARRAFSIFESNGRNFGGDLDDWFRAESELLHPVHIHVSETDGHLILKAEVPGFTAKELEVAVEPRRVTITGKRITREERKDKKAVYTETCSDTVLRIVDLPAGVDANQTEAALKDGVLQLTMPKAEAAKKIEVKTKQ